MPSRRSFISWMGKGALLAPTVPAILPRLEFLPDLTSPGTPPEDLAAEEWYWQQVQQAFNVDRSIIHLNNGGVCSSPYMVQRSMQSHEDNAYRIPFYVNRRNINPQIENIRLRLAQNFGCESEEIALTRNTSEGMEICQLGFGLMQGDEVLTTTHDYPRMINTWRQRAQREGIVLRQVSLPVPAEDVRAIVDLFEANITSRTRLIMICHMIDLTGQIMPVREITAAARKRGIPVLVDGAQAFGHLDFSNHALECEFYATSLHKWMMAPHGTGMLFVRKKEIGSLWPLMPAEEEVKDDIRKFEDTGTKSLSNFLAVADALAFHDAIGAAQKEARLRYLRDYWMDPLSHVDRIRFHTSRHPGFAAGLATMEIEGIPGSDLRDYLWDRFRIIVRPIDHPEVRGIRVSPGLQTTCRELDRFVEVILDAAKHGIS